MKKKNDLLAVDGRLAQAFLPCRGFSVYSTLLGCVLKLAIIVCSVLGMMLFICDAYAFDIDMKKLVFVSVVFSLLGAGISLCAYLNIKAKLLALVGVLGLGFAYIFFSGGLGDGVITPFSVMLSEAIDRISDYGYNGLDYMKPQISEQVYVAEALDSALMIICAVFSLSFSACIMFSDKVIPFYIVYACVCVTVFTFNTTVDAFGFTLFTSCAVSFGVISACEKWYRAVRGSLRRQLKKVFTLYSRSGGVGFVAMLLCLCLFSYPISTISEPFAELGAINGFMDKIRIALYGSSSHLPIIPQYPQFNIYEHPNGDRDVRATTRKYENTTDMYVSTQTDDVLYLRTWVGDTYSDGKWHCSSESDGFSDGFSPEMITELFVDMIYGVGNEDEKQALAIEQALTKQYVSMHVLYSASSYPTPSVYSRKNGMLSFDTLNEYEGNYKIDQNGVITTPDNIIGAKYSMVCMAPDTSNAQLLDRQLEAFIFMIKDMVGSESSEDKTRMYKQKCEALGVQLPEDSFVYKYFASDRLEREKYDAVIYDCLDYNAFAYEKYTDCPDDAELKRLSLRIFGNASVPADVKSINTALKQLSAFYGNGYKYTLEPELTDGDPVIDFLTETKEGYCVQFASSAVLLLRQLGIPARYAEGHIVTDYEKTASGGYISAVKDMNAHAWVEYYIEGCGWLVYEATNTYGNDMPVTANVSDTTSPPQTEPAQTDIPPESDETTGADTKHEETSGEQTTSGTSTEDTQTDTSETQSVTAAVHTELTSDTEWVGEEEGGNTLKPLFICLALVFTASCVVFIVLKLRLIHKCGIVKELERGERGDIERCDMFIEKYMKYSLRLLKSINIVPSPSTLPCELARRCDELFGNDIMSPLVNSYEKSRYGHGADKNDVRAFAHSVKLLREQTLKRVRGIKRIALILKGDI